MSLYCDGCEERIRREEHQRGYEEGAKAERERVLDELESLMDEGLAYTDYSGNTIALQQEKWDSIINCLRSHPTQEPACGNDPRCHGECSGEVDGTSNCPCKQPEKQQTPYSPSALKVTAELAKLIEHNESQGILPHQTIAEIKRGLDNITSMITRGLY